MTQRALLSLACFAGAGAWPLMISALEEALMSPLQRALRATICGAPLHSGFNLMGHCATCWAGSAILVAIGVAVFIRNERGSASTRTR